MPRYEIEFYEDEHGDVPVLRWLREDLTPRKRRALGTAMNRVLQELGIDVCGTEFGRPLGKGLFEFRLRRADLAKVVPAAGGTDAGEAKLLLRVFCHAHGNKLILLVGGYDKGADTSAKRQDREIAVARMRLKDWQNRQRRKPVDR
ncbi:type II toxin-antitoxin system RelE/ParE family toxin [Anaeromyxobacter oryzisoli]|uniref:type II toxin-antitoxin system RelE/ParE family toxin n=1 Tax=Anaeromyxobacter oryzisoli TaxID=2925408 RepID=UPI001F56D549|nr:type II toxin-antitoxin system RelE/ParE family toxin [Anaeromyxobacter sp. SG63]